MYNLYLLPQLRPYVPIAERVKDLTSDFKGKYTLLNRFYLILARKCIFQHFSLDNKIYSTQLTRQIDKHGSVVQVEEINPREYLYRQPQK